MTVLREGNLEMELPGTAAGRKFDDATHGLSHCMKAVDFIVELPDRFLFVEFKDPDAPSVPRTQHNQLVREFSSGNLDETLKYKYRDSFLYEWASGRANKPIHYHVLVAIKDLTEADLLRRTEALKSKLPVGTASVWQREIVSGCAVFNLAAWNNKFPEYQITRVGP